MADARITPEQWKRPRTVAVVVDNDGWFVPFARHLVEILSNDGDKAYFAAKHSEIVEGDIAFFLSCTRITPPAVLARNKLNLVVHASALPEGRGFSPLVWKILEGSNDITVTLIEAVDAVDAGAIFDTVVLRFKGSELNPELRANLGKTVVDMCVSFLRRETPGIPQEQVGQPSYYPRRRPADSCLDPTKSLAEQFNLLRVVDNARYPAFFDFRGHRYILKIEDAGPIPEPE